MIAHIATDQDLQQRVEDWIKREQEGEQFPVPFDQAWPIVGYSNKSNAKRKLGKLDDGTDFSSCLMKTPSGGRPSEIIHLTCDAFKHFCLMADTDQGRQVRQYFIEAEKKWRIVQEQHPNIALEVELEKLRIEALKLEKEKEHAIALGKQATAQEKQTDLNIMQFRHAMQYTILRESDLSLTGGSCCAALVLNLLRNLQNKQARKDKTWEWVTIARSRIAEMILGQFKDKAIAAGIKLLVSLGLIERRQVPNRAGRYYQYQVADSLCSTRTTGAHFFL